MNAVEYPIDPAEERDWYFTFGFGQAHPITLEPLHERYVRIHGTFAAARARMVQEWGVTWAFQYASAEDAGVTEWHLREITADETRWPSPTEGTTRKIYVASSWRNTRHPLVVAALRAAGHEVYDFTQPRPGEHGFHWSETGMASYDRRANSDVPVAEYLAGIVHPIAAAGFASDFDAMRAADTCVLVLPCGRSAHLELGWFAGQNRRTAVLLDDPCTPELMYLMCDYIAPALADLLAWLGPRPELECAGWSRKEEK